MVKQNIFFRTRFSLALFTFDNKNIIILFHQLFFALVLLSSMGIPGASHVLANATDPYAVPCFPPYYQNAGKCFYCPQPGIPNNPSPGQCAQNGGNQPTKPDPGTGPIIPDTLPAEYSAEEEAGLNRGSQSGGTICANPSNPINSATGNKFQKEVDYKGAGSSILEFVRYYNSVAPARANLGSNWRHSYDRTIVIDTTVSPQTATVRRPDGGEVIFFKLVSGWAPRPGVVAKLGVIGSEWTYQGSGSIIEKFILNTGNTARLASINSLKTRRGQRLRHSVTGNLLVVTDDLGHSLVFSYDTQDRLTKITDPSNNTIQYSYANDNLAKVTYQDASTLRYVYEDTRHPHHLTGIIDHLNNRQASWTYDALGRGTGSSHGTSGADRVTIAYNTDGSSTFTDALGQLRTYFHTTVNGTQKVANIVGPECSTCGGSGKNNTYDANGFLDIVTDFKGNVTDYDYNALGLIEQVIEAKGTAEQRITKTSWDKTFRLETCVVAPLKTTVFHYYGFQNSASGFGAKQIIRTEEYDTTNIQDFPTDISKTCPEITQRLNAAWPTMNRKVNKYWYWGTGLVSSHTGPRTADMPSGFSSTSYEYDTRGNLISIRNPLNHITKLQNYDAHGRAQTIIEPNGLTTKLTYDNLGRKDIVDVGGLVTNYDYYTNGLVSKITQPNGSFLKYGYDDSRRLVHIQDSQGNDEMYTYNAAGSREKTETFSNGGSTLRRLKTSVYDLENRLSKTIGAANQITNYLYDANGNVSQISDPGNNTSLFTYDALDRLKTITDANTGNTTRTYDANDNITSVTDPRGLVTHYRYDGLGNRKQLISPDTGTTDYTSYDGAGNLLSKTDALGKTTTYTFDKLNRITQEAFQDGSVTHYIYDVGLNSTGRLSGVVYKDANLPDTVVKFEWHDNHGRVESKMQKDGALIHRTYYTYNAITGDLETETTPGGHVINYKYLDARQPNSFNNVDKISSISVDSNIVAQFISYDPFGPANSWLNGNNVTINHAYNTDGQLDVYSQGGFSLKNTYTASGNLDQILGSDFASINSDYSYDALQRISGYIDSLMNSSFLYDANSNLNSLTLNGIPYSNPVNLGSNQLSSSSGPVSKTYSYDVSGNTINDGVFSFFYDDRGRLNNINNGAALYQINGLGQRYRKKVSFLRSGDLNNDGLVDHLDLDIIQEIINGTASATRNADCNGDLTIDQLDSECLDSMIDSGAVTSTHSIDRRYIYNAKGQLEGEYDAAGNAIQEIIWFEDRPLAIIRGASIFYIDTDHIGTPRAISNQSGTVVWNWYSGPYGTVLPNEDVDGDNVLFAFNLRFAGQYYDEESGFHYNINRFYDPATGRYLESDPIGLKGGLNPYGYVGGNPVMHIDPLGLEVDVWNTDKISVDYVNPFGDPDKDQRMIGNDGKEFWRADICITCLKTGEKRYVKLPGGPNYFDLNDQTEAWKSSYKAVPEHFCP